MIDASTSFIDYWDAVDDALLKLFGIDTCDAGIDPDVIAGAQEEGQTPEDFARWFGEKYDLQYLADWKLPGGDSEPDTTRAAATRDKRRPMTTTTKLTEADLRQFTGSENWYRHGINRNVLFTDGAKDVADAGGAYWLLDEIAIIQPHDRRVAAEEFQVWKLVVRGDRTATLTCDDGNGKIVFTKEIENTDFPLDEISLWFSNNVICLPSEH